MKTCVLIGRNKNLWVYAYSVEPKRAVVTHVGLWLRYTSVIGCLNKGPSCNDLQPLNWKRSLARARADVSPCHRFLSGAVFVRGANRLRRAPNKSRTVRRGEWRRGGLRKTRQDETSRKAISLPVHDQDRRLCRAATYAPTLTRGS